MGRRWLRRLVTLPVVILGGGLMLFLAVPLIGVTALIGVVRRRRFALLRMVLLGASYAFMEIVGLAALFGAWLFSGFGLARGTLERRAYAIQRWWAGGLWRSAVRILGLELDVDQPAAIQGPLIVLVRHVSLLDVLIPAAFVLDRGVPLRWVLKRELLNEPCLDVAGHWMPNHFVDRSSVDTPRELAAIESLASSMPAEHGLILFPEGTRFSRGRRERVLASLGARDPEAFARASALSNVLPPRLGGTLAAMRGAPGASALVIAHCGFEGVRTWRDLTSGTLVGATVRLRARHHALPSSEAERAEWLWSVWEDVDRWVADSRAT
jgi:1-acyl-sn-glycerol-3-phosphate acyltransferase